MLRQKPLSIMFSFTADLLQISTLKKTAKPEEPMPGSLTWLDSNSDSSTFQLCVFRRVPQPFCTSAAGRGGWVSEQLLPTVVVRVEEVLDVKHPAFERPSINTCHLAFCEAWKNVKAHPDPWAMLWEPSQQTPRHFTRFTGISLSPGLQPAVISCLHLNAIPSACLYFNQTSLHLAAPSSGDASDALKFILFP